MLEKYKAGIVFFGIFSLMAILFPPYYTIILGRRFNDGFAFILNPPSGASIDIVQLMVEVLFIGIVAVIYQINYEKIRKVINMEIIKSWFKNNY